MTNKNSKHIAEINNRPRKILGWATPAEVFPRANTYLDHTVLHLNLDFGQWQNLPLRRMVVTMATLLGLENAKFRAAEAACVLFIQRATTSITIAELVVEMGISPRTFHRYFPNKADLVGPIFAWTTQVFNDTITNEDPDTPVADVLIAAFRESLGGAMSRRTRGLFPLVFKDPAMWSVFLRHVHNGERTLIPVLAPRLGLSEGSSAARAAAAAVASATRIALEDMVSSGSDPQARYEEVLRAFVLERFGTA